MTNVKTVSNIITDEKIVIDAHSYFTNFVFINCVFESEYIPGPGFKNCYFYNCSGMLWGVNLAKILFNQCDFVKCGDLEIQNANFFSGFIGKIKSFHNGYLLNVPFADLSETEISGIIVSGGKVFINAEQINQITAYDSTDNGENSIVFDNGE